MMGLRAPGIVVADSSQVSLLGSLDLVGVLRDNGSIGEELPAVLNMHRKCRRRLRCHFVDGDDDDGEED